MYPAALNESRFRSPKVRATR